MLHPLLLSSFVLRWGCTRMEKGGLPIASTSDTTDGRVEPSLYRTGTECLRGGRFNPTTFNSSTEHTLVASKNTHPPLVRSAGGGLSRSFENHMERLTPTPRKIDLKLSVSTPNRRWGRGRDDFPVPFLLAHRTEIGSFFLRSVDCLPPIKRSISGQY